jgi:serine-type D-Ala-D-Ala carboxypeptidase (penicillin-binding protein 5/6)
LTAPPPAPQPSHVVLIGSTTPDPQGEVAPLEPPMVPPETTSHPGFVADAERREDFRAPPTEPATELVNDAPPNTTTASGPGGASTTAVSDEPVSTSASSVGSPVAADLGVQAVASSVASFTTAGVPTVPATAPETSTAEKRRLLRWPRRARHRRARPRGFVFAVLGVVVVLAGASAIVITNRLDDPPPTTTVTATARSSSVVPGSSPAIAWPPGVQSAFSIPALGVFEQSGPQASVPIASMTKLMTAHVVLADHPLAVGEDGPSITVTPNDVALYEDDVATDQANIEVSVGEVLTERQLLEGMLVHSANNFADLLAIWDAGSISAFVQKMNETASSLGMTHTTYADASGYSAQSVSSPDDQLRVAELDMANPVISQMVDQPSVTLPVGGTVDSFTPLLGQDGVVGVKSGFTSAAGGCDVLALEASVGGKPVEILAVVVGDHVGEDVITAAGEAALSLARSAVSGVRVYDALHKGDRVATASAHGYSTPIVTRTSASVLAWPDQPVLRSFEVSRRLSLGAPAGSKVGTVSVQVGTQKLQVAAVTSRRLPSLTFLERVF